MSTWCGIILYGVLATSSIAAHAQVSRPTVYLGVGELRGAVERSVGGPHTIAGQVSIPSSMSGLLAPYLGKNSYDVYYARSSSKGGGFSTAGVMLTQRVPLGVTAEDDDREKAPYFGFGLGLGITHATVNGSIGGHAFSFSKQATSKLVRLCVGKQINDKISAEFGYVITPAIGALKPNHVSLNLGIRL
jgi:hypothetical protein